MKIVTYSPEIFSWQKYGGISRYFADLIPAVMAEGWAVKVHAGLYLNAYLENLRDAGVLKGRYVGSEGGAGNVVRMLLTMSNSLVFNSYNKKNRGVVHQTYFSPFVRRNGRLVVTVHDLIHEKIMPERLGRFSREARRRSILAAEMIITVSNSTKRDLLEVYDIPPDRVAVVHHGVRSFDVSSDKLPLRGYFKNFFLYVGNRGGYKNFSLLVEAFAASASLRADFGIICFGGGSFTVDEMAKMSKHRISDFVIWIDGDDEVLGSLYRAASALVYPSLYEGFGLPVLEAMANGCPVVCSNVSSLPEVGGDAVVYFDPHDMDSIRLGLERIVGDQKILSELSAAGRERAKMFSWRDAARKTIAVYNDVIGDGY